MSLLIKKMKQMCKYCKKDLIPEEIMNGCHSDCFDQIWKFNHPIIFEYKIDPEEGFLLISSKENLYEWGLNYSNICPIWMNVEIGKQIINVLNEQPDLVFNKDAMNSVRFFNYKKEVVDWIK